ncbi:DUF4296 domain-containing protein [Muriicola soli]|uniref:DUF4296 domain-containing protein n=1 Tax=Muriicola soli TaxID=2507538 RepID=A0A411ECE2_9FLAO|nr:DUF4296 domain-containing protein [Muriicola soli]QBA65100.1 DUF4296 domain-containing protein [Muriicola soli]
MKIKILALVVLIFLGSCAEKLIEKPDDLIPKEKMTQLLFDLAILNSAKGTNKAILEVYFDNPTTFLFNQYGVDSLQFVKSDIYYASQPLVYESIYKEVAARLEAEKLKVEENRQKRNDSLIKRSRKIKDSISEK